MALHRGTVASGVGSPPSVTISATTNFNQDRATFNGTVSANYVTTTTIKFQVSTDNSTWSDATGGTTIANTSSQSVSVYYNATGLSVGTFYYVRLVATNSVGASITTASTGDFTTWSFQVYERSTSGGTTFTIPTVTPTGGSAVAVSIYDIIMFGGGGGGGIYVGGGGGGYQNVSSRSLSGARSVTTSVGSAGAAVDIGNGTNPTVGGNTAITGDLTSLTANGGGADTGANSTPASSGNGNAGGSNSAPYDYTPGDSKGYTNIGYGGSGGAGAVGGNGTANASGTTGGNGGAGVSVTSGGVTRAGGAGGGGSASNFDGGPATNGSQGANNTYGSGGQPGTAGQVGFIRFRYYAASALA